MDKTQKRWSFIVNVIYLAIIIGVFYLFMKYAFWTMIPFIIAFLVAAMLQKPLRFLTKSKRAPKGVISAVLSIVVFAVIAAIVCLGGAKVVSAVKDLVSYFADRCNSLAEFFEFLKTEYLNLDIAARLPSDVNDGIINAIDSISDYFASGDLMQSITGNITKLISPISSVVTTIPSVFIGIVICIVATCFMTSEFAGMKTFVLRQFSEDKKRTAVKAKQIIVSSVGKICRAYILIILITTAELCIGLSILKLIGFYDGAHIFTISFLIALIDIIPVLGTGTVLIPWSLYSLLTGEVGMCIGLIVIYAAITVIRQAIEPKLVAGQVGISPVVTIIAMYVGSKVFGFIGLFIVPLFVIVIKLLNDEGIIHLFNSAPKEENSDGEAKAETDSAGDETVAEADKNAADNSANDIQQEDNGK